MRPPKTTMKINFRDDDEGPDLTPLLADPDPVEDEEGEALMEIFFDLQGEIDEAEADLVEAQGRMVAGFRACTEHAEAVVRKYLPDELEVDIVEVGSHRVVVSAKDGIYQVIHTGVVPLSRRSSPVS